jgi:hypothetical protein
VEAWLTCQSKWVCPHTLPHTLLLALPLLTWPPQDIFDAWLTCQSKWMYLGPVYGSEEIAKQMPKERHEFQGADAKWRAIMGNVKQCPIVLQVGGWVRGRGVWGGVWGGVREEGRGWLPS